MNPSKPITLLLLATLISACSSYKNINSAQQWRNTGHTPAAFMLPANSTVQAPAANWWAQFNDEQLNSLVTTALEKNYSVRIAQASLAESRAFVRNSQLSRLPSIEADIQGTRQKNSRDIIGPNTPQITEMYQAGLDTSWELDLWGRVNNTVKLAKARQAQSQADLRAAQVSVSAEVAGVYIALRGDQALLLLAEHNTAKQAETLNLTQRFLQVGRGDDLDVARAKSQLELTRATIPSLTARINTGLNRLVVLTGTGVDTVKQQLAKSQPLPNLPATFAVGEPMAMLTRRPDIQRAESALAGALAEYNIQVADLYPSVSFTGGLGYQATDWDNLGNSGTDTFNFTPRIHWAALNLGRVKARINAADARTQGRLAELEQQIALALEETDNALQNFAREEERRLGLQQATAASYSAATASRKKFSLGAGDISTVLDAERNQLNVSAQLVQSDTQLLLNLIGIYKALGGGWELAYEQKQELKVGAH